MMHNVQKEPTHETIPFYDVTPECHAPHSKVENKLFSHYVAAVNDAHSSLHETT